MYKYLILLSFLFLAACGGNPGGYNGPVCTTEIQNQFTGLQIGEVIEGPEQTISDFASETILNSEVIQESGNTITYLVEERYPGLHMPNPETGELERIRCFSLQATVEDQTITEVINNFEVE